jgi:hypothetical protein
LAALAGFFDRQAARMAGGTRSDRRYAAGAQQRYGKRWRCKTKRDSRKRMWRHEFPPPRAIDPGERIASGLGSVIDGKRRYTFNNR